MNSPVLPQYKEETKLTFSGPGGFPSRGSHGPIQPHGHGPPRPPAPLGGLHGPLQPLVPLVGGAREARPLPPPG